MVALIGKAALFFYATLCLLTLYQPAHGALPALVPVQGEAPAVAETTEDHASGLKDAVSGMVADEVRQVLREQAATHPPDTPQHKTSLRLIDTWFKNGLVELNFLLTSFRSQVEGLQHLPSSFAGAWKLVSEQGAVPPQRLAVLVALVIGLALCIEYLFRRSTRSFRDGLARASPLNLLHRGGVLLLFALFEAAFFAIFAYSSLILYYFLLPDNGPAHLVAGNLVKAAYLIRLVHFACTILLAPSNSQIRLIPLTDWSARFLARWIVSGSIPIVLLIRFAAIFNRLEFEQSVFLGLIGLVIMTTYSIIVLIILMSRKRVRTAVEQTELALTGARSSFIARFAGIWHIAALLLVTLLILTWEIRLLSTGKIHFGKVLSSGLVLLFFFALDYWGQNLLQLAFSGQKGLSFPSLFRMNSEAGGGEVYAEEPHFRGPLSVYTTRLRIAYRVLLLALCVFILFSLWDINIAIGRIFTLGALLVLTILVVAYLIWQLFKIWIDTKISSEMPEQGETEEGGKGGSRQATLLLLLRKAALALLILLTFMALLSALGINIIPLVAGAGILGLAISFGAQSLIADIFAGIFFLIDDAFRVGDYVDCDGTKGTVEHISLRSLRLRHHRGMVHTLPFGKIGSVTNYTRDYIIMKLDLRVRYDTEVDKVRKIIKRIYQELQQDPTHGPKLIGKLKSQGVREMDDSAMIMRVKFTTRPGDQFELRREVYRRIQEAFKANNIEFAHRNVTVYMPPDLDQQQPDPAAPQTARQMGAAAGASLLQSDTEAQQQPEQEAGR